MKSPISTLMIRRAEGSDEGGTGFREVGFGAEGIGTFRMTLPMAVPVDCLGAIRSPITFAGIVALSAAKPKEASMIRVKSERTILMPATIPSRCLGGEP